ncbi:MAG: hypothetical protein HY791_26030 [Deltaproteobacteria bacterium]|nr:hypothetical protein [Deltaproteobacteria bacterium]
MKKPRATWVPGAGLVVMAFGFVLAVSVLAFGLTTPRLDRVWRMEVELRLGVRPTLSKAEFRMFQDVLCDHPQLAASLVDEGDAALISRHRHGLVDHAYAYWVREAGHPKVGMVVTLPRDGREELTVSVRSGNEQLDGVVTHDRPLSWTPRPQGDCPTLVEVRVGRPRSGDDKTEPNPFFISTRELP